MCHRSDTKLGHEPQQVGSDPDVVGLRPDGVLMSGQRRRKQRPDIDLAPLERTVQAFGRGTGSALGEVLAEPEDERFEHGRIDLQHLAGEHGLLAPQLHNRHARSHADPAGWPRVDGHPQLEAPRNQSALQVDGRPEIGALREQCLPATFGLSKESFGVHDLVTGTGH